MLLPFIIYKIFEQKFTIFSIKKIISFTFTEQINPIGKPITTPVNPQKTPAKIKDKAIPDEEAPILLESSFDVFFLFSLLLKLRNYFEIMEK